MSLITEIEKSLPDYYTLSNKTLIVIAHVRDETIYFYDELGPNTTIILLSQPKCYAIKKIFLEFMSNIGTTVIDIQNEETFEKSYRLDNRTIKIITNLLNDYKYSKIFTHTDTINSSQNIELYKLIKEYIKLMKMDNHYTYNKIMSSENIPCGIKKGILELYCRATNTDGKLDIELYKNYSNITSQISGNRKL